MQGVRARAAASVAALGALAAGVGGVAFVAARDDAEPPPPTTTTSSTTTTVPTEAVTAAIAASLQRDLPVALTPAEAACIADAVVAIVDTDRLDALAESGAPLSALDDHERDQLLRGVVTCLPPEQAAALLGSPTSTTPPVALPDEDL